ncbi:MAG: S49 family peptidase, partial [Bacteroidales bacterium]|nr:S49 family peptidase [Bacteroidales bacterium]
MKQFWKMLLAVICGLLIFNLIIFLLLAGMVGAASTGAKGSTVLPRTGVLAIDLSEVTITEQEAPADPMAMAQGQMQATLGIYKAVQAINIAATDPGVKFIYLKSDGSATGISTTGELRKALENFRRSGKAVIAWTEDPGIGNFYLNSVADKIYTVSHHGGSNYMLGLSGSMIFLKDLLDRLGVNYQLIRHGKYKSAGEMYVKNAPSPENMEQNQVMIDSMWETISKETAEARGI